MELLLEKLLAPILAGLIVLLGQYLLQPLVSRRIRKVESVVQLKHEALEKVVDVIEKFCATADDASSSEMGSRLIYQEVNHAYARLILYAEMPETLETFKELIHSMTPVDRARFYRQVRVELGLPVMGTSDEMEVPYFVRDTFRPRGEIK